jgi:hypothetical protein
MKHPKVVAYKQLPARLPILATLVWYLFLDHLHVPGWAWGIAGTVFAFVWIGSIASLWLQEPTEIVELKTRRSPWGRVP